MAKDGKDYAKQGTGLLAKFLGCGTLLMIIGVILIVVMVATLLGGKKEEEKAKKQKEVLTKSSQISEKDTEIKVLNEKKKHKEEEIKTLEASIKKVADMNEKSNNKALTLMLNEGKMSAFGADSRFAFLYQSLKFKATDAKIEDSKHGQEMSFEGIKEINPDTIILLNRTLAIGGDNSNADTVLNNALFKETNAVKNNRVIQLTSDLWYLSGGGLQSTKLMIEDVQKVLQ